MTTDNPKSSTRIRALDDAFRRSFVGGAVVLTAGVAAIPAVQRRSLCEWSGILKRSTRT